MRNNRSNSQFKIVSILGLFILVFILILLFLFAKKTMDSNNSMYLSEYSVFNTDHNISYFSESNQRFIPTDEETVEALSILKPFLEKQSNLLPLSKYKIQIFGWINSNGEKIIWANHLGGEHADWKERVIMMDDGGNYYFNVKINLATGQIYDFDVNGEA